MEKNQHEQQGGNILQYFRQTMRIMRLSLFFIVVSTAIAWSATAYSQNMKLSVNLKDATVRELIKTIEDQSEFLFLYQEGQVDLNRRVTIHADGKQLQEILNEAFKGTDIIYIVSDRQVVIGKAPREALEAQIAVLKKDLKTVIEQPQQKEISGKVTDSSGAPLPGATVMVKGTTIGTVTAADGTFYLRIPVNAQTLQVTFVGMKTQELPIAGQSVFNIILEEEVMGLEEVVVTALGIEKSKRSLSYTTEQVNIEPLAAVHDPSLATSLSGKVAGLTVSNASGAAGVGASSRIIIRGNRSITGNNQPLLVVDGVPYSNSKGIISTGTSDREVDSFDGFSNINGDDVESINVLKGPAAAALYGSAANNGVIIITTKKGKSGKPQVEFNSISIVDVPYLYPELQNEYAQGSGGIYSPNEATKSWGPKMTGQTVTNWTGEEIKLTPQPDNVSDFFVNGYNITNTISYSGGVEKFSNYFSYSNTTARSMIETDKLQRHNFNLRLGAELIPKLKIDFKITYFKQEMPNRAATGDDYFSPMQALLRMPRSIRTEDIKEFEYYTNEGSLKQNMWVPGGSQSVQNPYWAMYRRVAPTRRDRITSFVSLRYDITDWLWAQGRVSLDDIHDDAEEKIYWDAIYINDGQGNYWTKFSKQQNINADFMLNFNKKFSTGLGLNAMVGAEIKDNQGRSQTSDTHGLTVENKFALNYGISNTTTDYESRTQVQSLFGTAQLSYKSMIYLDFTGRNDWNSTLPSPYHYFYPCIGLSGIVSDIFNLPEVISFAKIRSSYAEVGSGASFASIYQTYGRSTNGPIGQITTMGAKVAEKLVPERSKSWEIGGEFKFFENRIGIDFTWYKSNTINQLINVAAPATSGYTSTMINCGNIENKGVELIISATPVEKPDFTWDTYLTFSRNKNNVKELAKEVNRYELNTPNLSLGEVWVEVGHPYGEIYSPGFRRDDQGRIVVSSTGLPILNTNADVYLGNYNYDWQSGLSNTFSFKNWYVSFLIDLNFGGIRTSATESMLALTGGGKFTVAGREGFVLDGVKEDGSVNDIPITAEAYWTLVGGRSSSRGPVELFTHEATNSRLREFVVGYTIPLKSNLINSLRVSAVGRNLFFFYNGCKWFDPDVSYDTSTNGQGSENSFLPYARTFGLNIKLSF